MKTIAILGAAVGALLSTAASAAPTVYFAAGSGATATGTTVFQNFEGYAVGASLGTNAQVFNSSVANTAARPAFGSTGNYAAVLGTPAVGSAVFTFAATTAFSFVLGSLDTYNSLTLKFADNTSITYNGGQIINDLTFPSGNQVSGETNGVVTYFTGSGPRITGATFTSTGNSFEFDNLAMAVPEPATWGLMILGFGMVGGAMRRRRTTVAYA